MAMFPFLLELYFSFFMLISHWEASSPTRFLYMCLYDVMNMLLNFMLIGGYIFFSLSKVTDKVGVFFFLSSFSFSNINQS